MKKSYEKIREIDISFVVPVLYYDEVRLNMLLLSIRSLGLRYEILIVNSNKDPVRDTITTELNVRLIESPPLGIYDAYNRGAKLAKGDWIMFFGYDDLVLPCAGRILSNLIESGNVNGDVHVFNVLRGSKTYKPINSKYGNIFRSWCHQGVVYHRSIFDKYQYNVKYKIQADHLLNIHLVNDDMLTIKYSKDTISYFDDGGISQSSHDELFFRDFPLILASTYGRFFSLAAYFRRSYIRQFTFK